MDMNTAYEQLITTVFPNAQVVYNRFHIAKHLNDTMNHVRIHVYQRLRKGEQQAQKRHAGLNITGSSSFKIKLI